MKKILIKNANVFDGSQPILKNNAKIVIEDNLVREIFCGDVCETGFDRVIDAKGLTAIPGLTDAHVHVSVTAPQDISRPEASSRALSQNCLNHLRAACRTDFPCRGMTDAEFLGRTPRQYGSRYAHLSSRGCCRRLDLS